MPVKGVKVETRRVHVGGLTSVGTLKVAVPHLWCVSSFVEVVGIAAVELRANFTW